MSSVETPNQTLEMSEAACVQNPKQKKTKKKFMLTQSIAQFEATKAAFEVEMKQQKREFEIQQQLADLDLKRRECDLRLRFETLEKRETQFNQLVQQQHAFHLQLAPVTHPMLLPSSAQLCVPFQLDNIQLSQGNHPNLPLGSGQSTTPQEETKPTETTQIHSPAPGLIPSNQSTMQTSLDSHSSTMSTDALLSSFVLKRELSRLEKLNSKQKSDLTKIKSLIAALQSERAQLLVRVSQFETERNDFEKQKSKDQQTVKKRLEVLDSRIKNRFLALAPLLYHGIMTPHDCAIVLTTLNDQEWSQSQYLQLLANLKQPGVLSKFLALFGDFFPSSYSNQPFSPALPFSHMCKYEFLSMPVDEIDAKFNEFALLKWISKTNLNSPFPSRSSRSTSDPSCGVDPQLWNLVIKDPVSSWPRTFRINPPPPLPPIISLPSTLSAALRWIRIVTTCVHNFRTWGDSRMGPKICFRFPQLDSSTLPHATRGSHLIDTSTFVSFWSSVPFAPLIDVLYSVRIGGRNGKHPQHHNNSFRSLPSSHPSHNTIHHPYIPSIQNTQGTLFNNGLIPYFKSGLIPPLSSNPKLFFSTSHIDNGAWIQFWGPMDDMCLFDFVRPGFALTVGALCPKMEENDDEDDQSENESDSDENGDETDNDSSPNDKFRGHRCGISFQPKGPSRWRRTYQSPSSPYTISIKWE